MKSSDGSRIKKDFRFNGGRNPYKLTRLGSVIPTILAEGRQTTLSACTSDAPPPAVLHTATFADAHGRMQSSDEKQIPTSPWMFERCVHLIIKQQPDPR